jgi:RHS repeat-associated protein
LDSSGSGWKFTYDGSTITATSRTGAVLVPALNATGGSYTDPNGNVLSTSGGQYFDTMSSITPVLTQAGAGTPTSPTTFTYVAPSGANATYTVNYTQYTVATKFAVAGTNEYGPLSKALISSITLPDSSSYTFTYEQTPGTCAPLSGTYSNYCITARIASVTLPTGGSIAYTYSGGSNGIETDGSTAGLTRTLWPGGQWQYARTQVSGAHWQTQITSPPDPVNAGSASDVTLIDFQQDGNTTVPTYNFYETQRQVNQGTSTPLLAATTCYNVNYVACTTTAITSPITQKDAYRVLSGGKTSLIETLYNANGLVTNSKHYDYGVTTGGAPSATYLLRQTITTYASLGNGIVNKPASILVRPGSGAVAASATYSYDETAVSTSTNTPQHIAVSGSRGDLTSLTTTTQTGVTLVRHFTYYDTGTVKTVTDVNGAQSSFIYGSGSCGNTFVTTENLPLSLSVNMTWDCTGGVMTSSTDANGALTSTQHSDPYYWDHASTVTDPALNQTNVTYAATTDSESVLLFNGNQSSVDILTTLDPFGRPQLAQRRENPGSANFDTIETDYDFMGRQVRTTLPYVSSQHQTSTSAPATTTSYDALGRILTVSDSGGGVVRYSYVQNDVTRTINPAPAGETVKSKQLEFDGLDRLTSVCEMTTTSGSGQCAQTSPQNGFWTKYAYNALGKVVSVTQNTQSTSPQARTFVYDMLGRLTSETNPENGMTTYAYDSASGCAATSNGDLIKKSDSVGNVTCYSYDAMHRVISVTYSGPYASVTSNKYFVYDSATINGQAVHNAKNRLAEAYTATCSTCTKITDIGYSYTATGNVSDLYNSSAHSGGYYHLTSTYWPNGNLDTLSGLPGLPVLTYGVDGKGRGYSVTASSGQDPVSSTLFNAADKPVSVTFGSGDSDSVSYDSNTGRATQYKFTVNGQSLIGNLTWNANQSLAGLSITDPFNHADSQNCSYLFDDLRRISSATCGATWSQTFSYDAFGNVSKSGSSSFQPTYSASTNRISTLPGFTPTYDSDGNLLNDSAHSYTWDADGHPVSIDAVSLTYDALGRMVEQNRNGSYTQIVYGPSGFKLALMNGQGLQKAFVPLPSGAKAVYTSSGLSYYRHPDWLGSSRLASTPVRTIYADVAYGPFGESYSPSGSTDLSFTGQNQDTVSGLYDFLAREYSPVQGRWISPDPLGIGSVKITNPRSWNRYAYALNDPLSSIDPNGECSEPAGLGAGQVGVCIDLFIAAPTIGDYGVFNGVGDDRGPVSDDPSATFRVEFSIVYDSSNNMVNVAVTTDPSVVSFLGGAFSASLTGDTNGSVTGTPNADGSWTVSIDTSSLNGWASAPAFAPDQPILLDMSLTISPDGTVESDGGQRSAFPSLEVWSYQPGQDPYNVLYIPESGNPGDLGALNQDVPDTSDENSVDVTTDNGDSGAQDGTGSDSGGGGGGGDDCNPDTDDQCDGLLVYPKMFVDPIDVSASAQLEERKAGLRMPV